MNATNRGQGTKENQIIDQKIKEKNLNIETTLKENRYMREWETILNLISRQMPVDRPAEQSVKESVEVKRDVKLRKKRLQQMVEEY